MPRSFSGSGASLTVTLCSPTQAPDLLPQASLKRPLSSVTAVDRTSAPNPVAVGAKVTVAWGSGLPLTVTTPSTSVKGGGDFPQPAGSRAATRTAAPSTHRFMAGPSLIQGRVTTWP